MTTVSGGEMKQRKSSGKLVTIAAGEGGLDQITLAISLVRITAKSGANALLVDCAQHTLSDYLELKIKTSLQDVITRDLRVNDAKHIVPDTSMLVASAGDMPFDRMLGPLAALSLVHEWVFCVVPPGCTPAHVRLMGACDHNVLMFDSVSDRFMRAYWMLDAIRARAPQCDPVMVGRGSLSEVQETYALFASTVHDFLGAPPPLAGIQTPDVNFDTLARQVLSTFTAAHVKAGAA